MSTVRLLQVTGPASAAGTVLGSQTPTEGASWAEVTGLGTIPSGGAILEVTADGGAAIRVAVMPPSETAMIPPHNGGIIKQGWFGCRHIPAGSRVWTKQL